MGCGCKNKGKDNTDNKLSNTSGSKSTTTKNESLQESVKKIIQKYYTK